MPNKTVRKGFTLIELLVVIAIIAILAAILFPVFAKAKESAKQSYCSNNIKQLVMGLKMYVDDHGNIPIFYNSDWSVTWIDSVKKYTSKADRVYECPSDTDKYCMPQTGGYDQSRRYSYAINIWLDGTIMRVKKPSLRIAICDGHFICPSTDAGTKQFFNPQGWHGANNRPTRNNMKINDGLVNVGFVDGHVQAFSYYKIDPSKTKILYSQYWDVMHLIDRP